MHMLVKDVEAWWNHINDCGVTTKYGVTLSKFESQPKEPGHESGFGVLASVKLPLTTGGHDRDQLSWVGSCYREQHVVYTCDDAGG